MAASPGQPQLSELSFQSLEKSDGEVEAALAASRQQAAAANREVDALKAALRAQEKLVKRPQTEDTAAQQKVAELEVSLRFARDELRLERDMLASVRHQVNGHELLQPHRRS